MEGRPTRTRPTQRSSSWIGIVLVVAIAVGIWLINGRDPGTGTSGGTGPETSEMISEAASPGGDAPSSSGSTVGFDPVSGLPYVDVAELPDEALDTLELIDAGGPFPYDEDGSTFGNYEGVLPERRRGYYEEYTVETPGLSHRGPLRIVTGDGDELYWTEDHYASFERIDR
ncbi:ribonuclease domain-containing protein [Nocardioides sp. C4-1]|uniref:ribonuclease domain-containing protein n=1 Tax=Nocardioides sp. C4-1 TaxID=3151851 RepID=UPI003263408C